MNRCLVVAVMVLFSLRVFAQDATQPSTDQVPQDTTQDTQGYDQPPQDTQQNPDLVQQPQQPLTQEPNLNDQKGQATPVEEAPPPVPEGAIIDGRLREGAFLSGPGSLTFILHHTLLGATGGLVTQGFANDWHFDQGAREGMLIGTLVGAGLGFGASAWWQFNHWIDTPVASYGIVNSVASGLFFLGLMDLISNDPTVLTWTGFIGAELGAWLTITIGGGDMPARHGLLMASGAGWGAVYATLLLAIIGNSGQPASASTTFDIIAMASGLGAGAMALTTLRYDPTTTQILRADLFGAGVGGAVLVLSALVLGGFNKPTPYVLSLLSATGAIAAVSLLWEESAERTPSAIYVNPEKKRPYANALWWW